MVGVVVVLLLLLRRLPRNDARNDLPEPLPPAPEQLPRPFDRHPLHRQRLQPRREVAAPPKFLQPLRIGVLREHPPHLGERLVLPSELLEHERPGHARPVVAVVVIAVDGLFRPRQRVLEVGASREGILRERVERELARLEAPAPFGREDPPRRRRGEGEHGLRDADALCLRRRWPCVEGVKEPRTHLQPVGELGELRRRPLAVVAARRHDATIDRVHLRAPHALREPLGKVLGRRQVAAMEDVGPLELAVLEGSLAGDLTARVVALVRTVGDAVLVAAVVDQRAVGPPVGDQPVHPILLVLRRQHPLAVASGPDGFGGDAGRLLHGAGA